MFQHKNRYTGGFMNGFHYCDSEISTVSRVTVTKTRRASERAKLYLDTKTRSALRMFCAQLTPPQPMGKIIKLAIDKYLFSVEKVRPFERGSVKRSIQVVLYPDQDSALRIFCDNWEVSKGEAVSAALERMWKDVGFSA